MTIFLYVLYKWSDKFIDLPVPKEMSAIWRFIGKVFDDILFI